MAANKTRGFQRKAAVLAYIVALGAAVPTHGQKNASATQSDDEIRLSIRARPEGAFQPKLQYQVTPNPRKPYVKQLFTPAGINVLRDAPVDHRHHHALMFAVAVDGVDCWAEWDDSGRQISRRVEGPWVGSADGSEAFGHFSQFLDWTHADGRTPLLAEERNIWVHAPFDVPTTLVTWRCRLSPPEGKLSVTLSGSPYFGLGMRFLPSMDTGGEFSNADGRTGVEGTNAVRSRWCAYTASADGNPVTIAVFDDKTNARHPATWFTMENFAYISATLGLDRQPLKVEAAKPLALRYGVAAWDGKVDKAQIEQLYRRWLDLAAQEER
ncbi:MAG: PmoA family protein [Pirellulales bacterium]|nr:PmoA family protein [Pirellulales bacterium]